jgi:hypothetical protein
VNAAELTLRLRAHNLAREAGWGKTRLFALAGTERHPVDTERLMEYWAHDPRGRAKIKWELPCAFCRCLIHAGKYFPKDPKGLCSNLELRATGHRPNAEHSRTKHCPC